MAKELEIEFKNLLSEIEYEMLLAEYHLTDLHTQTNVYFDTEDYQLKQKKMGLRIRKTNNYTELTLKTPTSNQHTLLEVTDQLETYLEGASLDKQALPEVSEVAIFLNEQGIKLSDLMVIGELTTTRGEINVRSNVLLVLDKSNYYGKTDYELEMEVTDAKDGEVFFLEFLAEHNIPIRVAEKKIARMMIHKNNFTA